MKLAFGCDPNAMEFKKALMAHAKSLGHECVDYESSDPIYANVAIKVGEDVAAGVCERGVLLCGTGIGVCIAANKVKGVYAALLSNVYAASRATLSNNANIVTMGSQVTGLEVAKCLLEAYLGNTYVHNDRSGPKVDAICAYERKG